MWSHLDHLKNIFTLDIHQFWSWKFIAVSSPRRQISVGLLSSMCHLHGKQILPIDESERAFLSDLCCFQTCGYPMPRTMTSIWRLLSEPFCFFSKWPFLEMGVYVIKIVLVGSSFVLSHASEMLHFWVIAALLSISWIGHDIKIQKSGVWLSDSWCCTIGYFVSSSSYFSHTFVVFRVVFLHFFWGGELSF